MNEESSDILVILQKDLQNNFFYRYDSGISDSDRFIVIASEFKEQFFNKSKNYLIDKTFKMAPSELHS